jgi:hypothetical protein
MKKVQYYTLLYFTNAFYVHQSNIFVLQFSVRKNCNTDFFVCTFIAR